MQSAAKINPQANPLGKGAYASVYADVDPNTGEALAIKKTKAKLFSSNNNKKRLLREIKLLRIFQGHPNIVPLRWVSTSITSSSALNDVDVTFKKFDTDLFKVINSRQSITEAHVQYILYQILCGVNFLHSAHVVHRDLKPANIVLNANCDLAICDFGLARALKPLDSYIPKLNLATNEASAVSHASSMSKQPEKLKFPRPLTPHVVTRWYRAPEIILVDDTYGLPVDMWSIGCILAELLKMQLKLGSIPLFPGRSAFPHSNEKNPLAWKNKSDQLNVIFDIIGTPTEEDIKSLKIEKAIIYLRSLPYKPPQSFKKMFPGASPAAIDLLNRLLTFNPAKRISAHDALRHEFLAPMVDATMNLTFPLPGSITPSPDAIRENEESLLEYYHAEMDINDQCEDQESDLLGGRLHQLIMDEIQKYNKVNSPKLEQTNSIASSAAAASSSTAVISSALSAASSVNSSAIASKQSSIEKSEVFTKPSDVTSGHTPKVTHDVPSNPPTGLEETDTLMTDDEVDQRGCYIN